jgi:hypothetical protein
VRGGWWWHVCRVSACLPACLAGRALTGSVAHLRLDLDDLAGAAGAAVPTAGGYPRPGGADRLAAVAARGGAAAEAAAAGRCAAAAALDQAGRDIESQWVQTPRHGDPITAASRPAICRLGQRELRADWLLRGGSWAAGHSTPTPAAAPPPPPQSSSSSPSSSSPSSAVEAAPPLRIPLGRALLFAVCACVFGTNGEGLLDSAVGLTVRRSLAGGKSVRGPPCLRPHVGQPRT